MKPAEDAPDALRRIFESGRIDVVLLYSAETAKRFFLPQQKPPAQARRC